MEYRTENQFELRKHARYVGRLDWRDPNGPLLSWAGGSIAVRFRGQAITLRMIAKEREDSWVDLIVDGELRRTLHIDGSHESTTLVMPQAGDETHTLEVYKRTEAMFGTVQFLGFELPEGGRFMTPPPRREHRLEIIGDSISAGSGNEGKNGDPNIAEHENNRLAYGTLAAEALNAELHTTAVSGIGLAVNYGDERVGAMPEQYRRLNPLDPDTNWDFGQWIPEVVLINLGTNDNNYAVDRDEFVAKYKHFAGELRKHYPDALMFISLGPFIQSPVKEHILASYEEIRAADPKVRCFLFDPADVERDGLGETGHPNVITHRLMAEQLIRVLQRDAGWQQQE